MPVDCPFCTLQKDRIVSESELTLTVRDAFPVSEGHSLVISKRHVESLLDCNTDEKVAMFQALEEEEVAL
ncbi:MAG: HIT family protein, partial [bacterium]